MTFKRNILPPFLALGLLASPAALAPATAQAAQPEAVPAPEAAPTPEAAPVDDAKLRSFAVAYVEVARVAQTYQPRIQQAADANEQERLREEATQGMVQAVENAEGITVEEYSSIFTNAQSDPQLAQQIDTFVQEAAKNATE